MDIAPTFEPPAFDAPVFSALDTEEFTPPGSPRTYVLGVLNYRQRAAFTRDMRRSCGDRPDRAVMLAVLRECLRELAPANLDDALATVDEAEAAPSAGRVFDEDIGGLVVAVDSARVERCGTEVAAGAGVGRATAATAAAVCG
jgi:hypothetical protein